MRRKKKTVGKNKAKTPHREYKPIIVCEETWMLLQDAADLMDEVKRLIDSAAKYDEDFQRSRIYKKLVKKVIKA